MHQIAEVIDHLGGGARALELRGQRLRHPVVAGAVRRGEDEDVARPPTHAGLRLATSRVRRPDWTISCRWFTISRSSKTTPPSFMARLAAVWGGVWSVSRVGRGGGNLEAKPRKARTPGGGRGTRQPSPDDRHRARRSG